MIAEIVSLSGYEAQVSALMTEDERMGMEFSIASGPEDHPLIPGTGGFRGRGKSGGFRVVYFFMGQHGRIYMAAIYAKSRRETLSAADRNALAKVAAEIKSALKGGH